MICLKNLSLEKINKLFTQCRNYHFILCNYLDMTKEKKSVDILRANFIRDNLKP